MKKSIIKVTLWTLSLNALLFISGCGGGSEVEINGPATLTSISITPATPAIVQGDTQQFIATGTYSDNSTNDITSNATWTSTNTSAATVTRTGLATGTSVGESTIEASLGGKTSFTLLTVTATALAPAIVTPPANQSVAEGQTATFNVVASGTAPLHYQWVRDRGTNDQANVGTDASSYTTPVTAMTDNDVTFSVVVSNTTSVDATSDNATLTVTPVAPTISTQPANQSVTEGQTATFNVVASGTAPLAYQWRKNGTNIIGATTSSYITPATTIADYNGASYSVAVSNSAGNVTSAGATLTVTVTPVAPTIVTPPASQSVAEGQTATFNVIASGTAPLAYQWRKNGSNVIGATTSSYTTPVTSMTDNNATFSVVVSNTTGNDTSSNATLTVSPVAPAIVTPPANQSVAEGQTATFNVIASGTAPLAYQWRKNGTNIIGATTSSYTTPATTIADDNNATFSVVASNTAGNVTSNNATLTVTALPTGVVRILFLHHSTGMYVFERGVEAFFTDYNATNGTQYQIDELWYPSNSYSPRYGNYPYDYWNLWVNPLKDSQYDGELTLDDISALNYDVIVFKHCYPVSYIYPDTGNPVVSSVGQTIENYQLQYAALKARMKQFPSKKFILWTGAALNVGSFSGTAEEKLVQAQRAQTFFNWVKNTWDEHEPDDNIFIWDFYALETAGSEPYMNDAYDSGDNDPHPNPTFSATVAPYFAQRIVDVIEGRGNTGSITGH